MHTNALVLHNSNLDDICNKYTENCFDYYDTQDDLEDVKCFGPGIVLLDNKNIKHSYFFNGNAYCWKVDLSKDFERVDFKHTLDNMFYIMSESFCLNRYDFYNANEKNITEKENQTKTALFNFFMNHAYLYNFIEIVDIHV